jgi:hypothetical protein
MFRFHELLGNCSGAARPAASQERLISMKLFSQTGESLTHIHAAYVVTSVISSSPSLDALWWNTRKQFNCIYKSRPLTKHSTNHCNGKAVRFVSRVLVFSE